MFIFGIACMLATFGPFPVVYLARELRSESSARTSLSNGILACVTSRTVQMLFVATFVPLDASGPVWGTIAAALRMIIALLTVAVGAAAAMYASPGHELDTTILGLTLGWGGTEALAGVASLVPALSEAEVQLGVHTQSVVDTLASSALVFGFVVGAYLALEAANSLRFSSARVFSPALLAPTAALLAAKTALPITLDALGLSGSWFASAVLVAAAAASVVLARWAHAHHMTTRKSHVKSR